MTMKKADLAAKRIAELEAIEEMQDRIDRVAKDLSTGTHRYTSIDAWTLGELLGVYFADCDSWTCLNLGYPVRFEPSDFEFPFAENIELLAGKVPKARYQQLVTQAATIIDEGEGRDLRLTREEEELLRGRYCDREPEPSCVTLVTTSVRSSDGEELHFESTLSDGYPDLAAWSPYDIAKGGGFDTSDYVMMD